MKQIFEEEPGQWGLRGDPYLWKDLRDYMTNAQQPENEEEFEKLFHDAFKKITGEDLTPGRHIFMERYNFGGMSSGRIDSDFWIAKGFPLLRERFKQLGR